MKVVERRHDKAYVCAWVPDFPKGKGIEDAVNSGLGLPADLREIEVTEEEWVNNWYNREPREAAEQAAENEAKITAKGRQMAVDALIAAGELPAGFEDKQIGG